jgi:hypothetical protein
LPCQLPPPGQSGVVLEDESDEVGARGDPGLLEHLPQVVVDRSRAQEQLRGDLAVGGALADGHGDAELLRGQRGKTACSGLPGGRPRGAQLSVGALRPGDGANPGEGLHRRPQVPPGVGTAPGTAQPLADQQLGPGLVHWPVDPRMQLQGGGELGHRSLSGAQQRPTAGGERLQLRCAGRPGPRLELGQRRNGQSWLAGAGRGLDQVGDGGQDLIVLAAMTRYQWTAVQVRCYGMTRKRDVLAIRCLWYGALGGQPVQVVLSRPVGAPDGYELALVTTDLAATPPRSSNATSPAGQQSRRSLTPATWSASARPAPTPRARWSAWSPSACAA